MITILDGGMGGELIRREATPRGELWSAQALLDALVEGYRGGRSTESLFGTAWDAMWEMPLSEVRKRFGIVKAVVDTVIPAQAA